MVADNDQNHDSTPFIAVKVIPVNHLSMPASDHMEYVS